MDIDRKYQLETIGILKSSDNIDGLFTDYVSAAYNDYFSRQNRFIINDLSKTDVLINQSKIKYSKLIQDNEILAQIARSVRVDSIIRTTIMKQGFRYEFTLDWMHTPHMEILSSQSFTIDEPQGKPLLGKDIITEPLSKNISLLIAHLPFLGHVTGRDEQYVTLNIGSLAGIKRGDTLLIGTLDEVKKHPLFNAIVDWRISNTGRVEVEQVEEHMSFCKVLEEDPTRQIGRYQKVLQILAPQQPQEFQKSEPDTTSTVTSKITEGPRIGYFGFGLFGGGLNRQMSEHIGSSYTGGGATFGGKASGEVWLTREWFAEAEFRYAAGSFSQTNPNNGALSPISKNGSVADSFTSYLISFGYTYHLTEDLLGPNGWIKLGYKSNNYSLPISSPELTGPISFNSIFVGVGGELPIQEVWGAIANFNFRLITSIGNTAAWVQPAYSSSSDVEVYLGGYRRIDSKMTVRLGLEVIANGADFGTNASLSQKMITIGPSLLYYF